MSTYDVAIGADSTTLNNGASQVYANRQAREKLFKGTESGTQGKLSYTANWDARAAPTFVLAPPPEDKWLASIDLTGKNPQPATRPTEKALQLVFTQFYADYTMGSAAPVSGTADQVIVFASVAINDNKLSITPLSIWLDESKLKMWDKLILHQILKQVLQKSQTAFAGIQLPNLSFSEAGASVEFTSPVVAIQGGLLIVAASLKSKGTVDINGVTWPQKSLFTLVSTDVIEQVARSVAKSKIENQEFSGDGKTGGGMLSYEWTAKIGTLDSINSDATDKTRINARATFSFDATLKPLGGPCGIKAATSSL